MKKVININFQGRVVPIEESAYEMLQQYISSLRTYFANEDGRDEIVNDIESRIGELFDDRLKKGANCIADADVEAVMNNMGRPSDFEQADSEDFTSEKSQNTGSSTKTDNQSKTESQQESKWKYNYTDTKKRLYRDESDKLLGGVCSGVAHYLNLDPAIVRIIFALLVFVAGGGILAYIILWIVLPSTSLITNVRKRLYRDTEDRVFQGVCGGLGKYFDINSSIPRIIFAAPFILGLVTSIGRHFFFNWSVQIGGFGGGTFFLAYLILWIVVPEAKTASEKLEMKGEKVDVNSIRDTIMGDLQGFKERAEKMGTDLKNTAQKMGTEAKENIGHYGKTFGTEAAQVVRRNGSGLGHALGIIIKAFIYFIGGIIALALFIALVFLLSKGVGILPIRDYFLDGAIEHLLAWASVVLFIGVPIIAILIWFIRRISKVRVHNKYLSYTFTSLWFVGLFCVVALGALLIRDFGSVQNQQQDVPIFQPTNNLLVVDMDTAFNIDDEYTLLPFDGFPSIGEDSLLTNNVRINVVKSKDSLYHVQIIKYSNGKTSRYAGELASNIHFTPRQQENSLLLPEGFFVTRNDKYRNQRVIVKIEVPIGKKIKLSDKLRDYQWFNMHFDRRHRNNWSYDWNNGYGWEGNKEMIMTKDNLKTNERIDEDIKNKIDEIKKKAEENNKQEENTAPVEKDSVKTKKDSATYRYHAFYKKAVSDKNEPIQTGMNMLDISPKPSFLQ